MWCHQAVRVGNHAIVLGRNRRQPPARPASPSQRQKRLSAEVLLSLKMTSHLHMHRSFAIENTARTARTTVWSLRRQFEIGMICSLIPLIHTQINHTPQDPPKEQWSVIPQAQRGLNRGRGAIRRHNSATAANPPSAVASANAAGPSSSSQAAARRASTGTAASAAADGSLASPAEDDDDLEEPMELSVEPVS